MSYKVSDTAEVWKSIKGFEGLYEVSNLGRVRSLKADGKIKIVKILNTGTGYKKVGLYKGGQITNKRIHRLVAEAFIPNPDNLPQVNHIDEDSSNNKAENLEWCTGKYNANYGTRNQRLSKILRCSPKISKQVEQFSAQGELIRVYPSAREAGRVIGHDCNWICECCNGKTKMAYGFIWRYKK